MQAILGPFSREKRSDLQRYVLDPFNRVYSDLSSKWDAAGCMVARWTEKFIPQKYHLLVMRLFHALPVAIVCSWMPLSITVIVGMSTYVSHIAYGPFAQSTYDTIFTGAFLGMSYNSISNASSFLATFNPLYLLSAAMYGVAASALFSRTNLVAERS